MTGMIQRIPQRTNNDCAICTVAMVMGSPYTYEDILCDSKRYPHSTEDGKFLAWWETYFHDKGFQIAYRPLSDLSALSTFSESTCGIVGMDIPKLNLAHFVAVDAWGIVDPADNAPDHVAISEYIRTRQRDGCIFHNEFLEVRACPKVLAVQ